MNRAHHLKQTLLQNILDNEDYDNLQFVILNYNSSDDMDELIKKAIKPYIDKGKVVYYYTKEPKKFSHSHSKNVAFKIADGEIVCNINADHYTGKGFANYVNEEFNKNHNIILTPIDYHKTRKDFNPPKDVLGKLCVKRTDFINVNGFDERMEGYGFEDYDFVNRVEFNQVERVLIDNTSFLKFIHHDEAERYSIDDKLRGVHSIYIQYISPSSSELIFLYKDWRFEKGTLVDNSTIGSEDYLYSYKIRDFRFEYSIKESRWIRGIWKEEESNNSILFFAEDENNPFCLKKVYNENNILKNETSDLLYYSLTDIEQVYNLMDFNYFFRNRSIMEENLLRKDFIVNSAGYGCARLFKNFKSTAISI